MFPVLAALVAPYGELAVDASHVFHKCVLCDKGVYSRDTYDSLHDECMQSILNNERELEERARARELEERNREIERIEREVERIKKEIEERERMRGMTHKRMLEIEMNETKKAMKQSRIAMENRERNMIQKLREMERNKREAGVVTKKTEENEEENTEHIICWFYFINYANTGGSFVGRNT
ncbi:UNVERIFIED_CONTAM: hypothetical protein PYX00_011448 [Menopon gallinae]|uniref:Uncharacterized protein n=1 Tax=Menopon gallinae TaxID=328185 RepID=A0AAW2H7L3_9NEOP